MAKTSAAKITLMKLPKELDRVLDALSELPSKKRVSVLESTYEKQDSPATKSVALKLRFRILQEEAMKEAKSDLTDETADSKQSPATKNEESDTKPNQVAVEETATANPDETGPEDKEPADDVPPELQPSAQTLRDLERLSNRPILLPSMKSK